MSKASEISSEICNLAVTSRDRFPREEDGTKARILRAAESLFASKGFNSSSLKDVSQGSGVNSALVSYYFGSKDGLREAVIEKQSRKAREMLAPFREGAPDADPAARFTRLVASVISRMDEDAVFYRLNLWALVDGGAVTAQISKDIWNPVYELFMETLRVIAPSIAESELEARCALVCGALNQYARLRWHDFHRESSKVAPADALAAYRELLTLTLVPLLCRH